MGNSDLVVTVIATVQGSSDSAVFVLSLRRVPTFNPPAVPLLEVEVGSAAGRVLATLTGGAVYGELTDPQDRVRVNAAGEILLQTALSSAGTVVVTLFAGRTDALGNGRRPVAVTISFYDSVAASSEEIEVAAGIAGEYYALRPSGGSGSYNFRLVSPSSGVALLSPSRAAGSRVSVRAVSGGERFEVVIEITDAGRVGATPERTTLTFVGQTGLAFSPFPRQYYVAASARREVLVTVEAVNGMAPYIFVPSDSNFLLESGRVLVFMNPSNSPASYSTRLVVTDSASPPESRTITVRVDTYTPLAVAATVTQAVMATRTGRVFTVTASGGSGTYGFAVAGTTPTGHGARMADNVLELTEEVGDGWLTVNVRVSETGAGYGGEMATVAVVLRGATPLSLVTPVPDSPVYEPGLNPSDSVLTVSVGGGFPPYRYEAHEASAGWFMSGSVVLLGSPASEGDVLRGSIVVTDGTDFNVLSVPFTMSFRVTSAVAPAVVAVQYVAVTETTPVSLVSLSAVGNAPLTWRMVADSANVATVAADGVVRVTNLLAAGVRATMMAAVTDGGGQSGTVAITVAFYRPLGVSSPVSPVTVAGGYTGAVLTVAVTNGVGAFDYSVSPNPAGLQATVDASGRVSLLSALGRAGATLAIAVTDRTVGERVTVSLVLVRQAVVGSGLSISGARWFEVSPGYTGMLVSLSVSGGSGTYTYRRVSGATEVTVDGSGVVSLTAALSPVGRTAMAVIEAQDNPAGSSGRITLSLQVVAPAPVGDAGAMYLVGGNVGDGNDFTLRADVWRSTDGETWNLATGDAGFPARHRHQLVSHRGSLWVIEGDNGSAGLGDVWVSGNGTNWQEVETVGNKFSSRYSHQAVSHGGSLWVVGGDRDDQLGRADVWRSADGATWDLVTAAATFPRNRRNHQLVSHGNSLWLIAGEGIGGGSVARVQMDVWRSADGATWDLVTATAGFELQDHQAVSHGGALWVMGGQNDGASDFSNVWQSTNGAVWTRRANFGGGRVNHQMVSYAGSLWVIGGNGVGDNSQNDVWASADGVTWGPVTATAAFAGRRDHQVAVLRGAPPPFVRPLTVAPIAASLPAGVRTVFFSSNEGGLVANDSMTVATVSVLGGSGPFRFLLVNDFSGSYAVGADGALIEQGFVGNGTLATVSVLVGDAGGDNRATAVMTVVHYAPVVLGESSEKFAVSPGYLGLVRTLPVYGGFGAVHFRKVSGAAALSVGSSGAVSLVQTVAVGSTAEGVFAVWDDLDMTLLFTLSVEVVPVAGSGEAMYLSGGESGYGSSQGGVFRSVNGVNWNELVSRAAFGALDSHGMAAHNGSLWVVGGRNFQSVRQPNVWASADGTEWALMTTGANFARENTGLASFNGRLWMIGGWNGSRLRDVWSSADGRVWTAATLTAAFDGRDNFGLVSLGGTLWLAGGFGGSGRGSTKNDVWYSTNGAEWTAAGAGAKFQVRSQFPLVAHDDKLWVLGGLGAGSNPLEDVWHSTDGAVWTPVSVSVGYAKRGAGVYAHAAVSYGGKLWVTGGQDGGSDSEGRSAFSGVWSSTDGVSWERVSSGTHSSGIKNHEMVVFEPAGSVYEVAPIVVAPIGLQVVGTGGNLPVAVVALRATGGDGTPGFEMAADSRNAFEVGGDSGVLQVTAFPANGTTATVSVRVFDASPVNRATVAVTVVFVEPLFMAGRKVRVSPDYAGVVLTLSVTGGYGDYSFAFVPQESGLGNRADGERAVNAAVTVDAAGVVSLKMTLGLAVGMGATAVFRVTDEGGLMTQGDLGFDVVDGTGLVSEVDLGVMLSVSRAEYRLSPDFTGVVTRLRPTGGDGNYVYSRMSGTTAVTVLADGAISVSSPLAAGSRMTMVFVVTDGDDRSARFSLDLAVAAAGGGGEAMYVVAGQEGGSGNKLGDVWRSTDGVNWTETLADGAAFDRRDDHGLLVHGGYLWVVGGNLGFDSAGNAIGRLNDVWRSADGENWRRMLASAPFGGRNHFSMVSFGGSMWVVGGYDEDDDIFNDAWRSANGVDWTRASAGAFDGHVDSGLVSLGGKMWIVGGTKRNMNGDDALSADLWSSADGISWTLEGQAGFAARERHMVAVHNGTIWVAGGHDGDNTKGDVWYSTNGTSWSLVTATAAFDPRSGAEMVSFGASLVVIGGGVKRTSFVVDDDVWASANGADWTQVAANAAFSTRSDHRVAVFTPRAFAHQVAPIAATGPTAVRTVFVDATAPATVATVRASGGDAPLWFELADDHGAFVVGDDGAVVATSFLGSGTTVTLTVLVGDETPFNRATVAMTLFHFLPLGVMPTVAEFVVAAGYTGLVQALSVTGGGGSYRFSRESGSAALAVDAAGLVSVVTGLPAGRTETAVFAVRDGEGVVVRFSLTVRTAAAGAYQQEAMYLIGGTDGSVRNDIWRSTDGVNWTRIVANAGFSGREDHEAVVFGGKLWVMGGYDNVNAREPRVSDVWTTADGEDWTLVTAMAAFGDRGLFGLATLGGSLFVFGGAAGAGGLGQQDVWASTDGANWGRVTVSAAFGVRWNMAVVAHGGNLWMSGGSAVGSPSQRQDVWRSADGRDWTFVTDSAFTLRTLHEMVSHGGSLWVAGGINADGRLADVWASGDNGATWTLKAEGAFPPRRNFGMVSHGGSLWVAGGDSSSGLHGDVWASADGESWEQMASGLFDGGREDHRLVAFARNFSVGQVVAIVGAVAAPVTVGAGSDVTLTGVATGGVGALSYEVAADGRGVAEGGRGGPVVTNFLNSGERATITVVVTDSTPVNRATVAVTLVFVAPLSVGSANFVFSPNYVGVLGTLGATGGAGGYRYEYAGTVRGLEVGAETGVVSVVSAISTLPTEQPVFVVRDGSGSRVEVTAALSHYRNERKMAAYLTGGGNGGGKFNDVWIFDTDVGLGNEFWRKLTDAAFSARDDHQMVFHNNYLWVIGGESGRGLENDIWRSVDGVEWLRIFPEGDVFSAREGHQAVSHGGHLFVIGGGAGDARYNDVWRSTDGTRWTRVVANADFSGRKEHQVVSHGGHLILSGGEEELSGTVRVRKNDVWRSADGVSWTLVVANAQFSARTEHQMVARGGSLWVLGGEGTTGRELNIWASTNDGVSWTQLSGVRGGDGPSHESFFHLGKLWSFGGRGSSGFSNGLYDFGSDGKSNQGNSAGQGNISARGGHQVAVAFDSDSGHQSVRIDLTSPNFVPAVAAGEVLPQAVFTVTASGGNGRLRYGLAGGEDIMRVDENGVVWLVSTASNGDTQSLTVRVWAGDSTPVSYTEVAVTVYYVAPLSMPEPDFRYAVPPGRTGELFTVSVKGGSGHYDYQKVSEGTVVGLFFELNKVLLTTKLDAGSQHEAVFEVRDQGGGNDRLLVTLTLLVADSDADPKYMKGTLFLSGGTHTGVEAGYGDVWRSVDGSNWTLILTATYRPWRRTVPNGYHPRAYHQMVAYKGSLFIQGGLNSDLGGKRRDIWVSADGARWNRILDHSGEATIALPARDVHQMVSYQGSLHVIGGILSDGTYKKNVWRSDDGVNWKSRVPLKPPPLGHHQAAVHNGTLFVMGGLSVGTAHSNVYYTRDAAQWSEFTGADPLALVRDRQLVSHRGSLYLIGHSQVWRSADGRSWEQQTPGGENGSADYVDQSWVNKWREGYQAVSFNGYLWVIGGHSPNTAFLNDVWRSEDGVNWTKMTQGTKFQIRTFHQVTPLYRPRWFSLRVDEDGQPVDPID